MSDPASDSVNGAQGHAAQRYATGFSDREPYLVRARRIAKLTIPSMFREWGATGMTDDVTPWQSLGSYCVNNFSAKTVLAAWPPGIPNVNLKPSAKTMRDFVNLPPDQRGDIKAALDKALSLQEMAYVDAMEEDGDRAVFFDAMRHMTIGGNHGLHVTPKGPVVGYPLEQYVVWRDRAGNLTEFCIEDPMAYESMDRDIQDLVRKQGYGPTEGDVASPDSGKVTWAARNPLWAPINVYTYGVRRAGTWTVYTEVMGIEVPGSRHPYSDETLPYMFLRMVALKKEAYGRSYCEDYEGDLQTYDAIWQALTEGGAALARMITLVRAGGTTNKDDYAKAANGAVITGDKDEVAVVRADKGGDLSVVVQEADKIEGRLERIFILNSAVERPGERVTATEISFKAKELDTTLGGVYSNLVVSWQRPLAILKVAIYQRLGRMAKLPAGSTKVTIITGDAALGRMQKAQALEEFLQVMGEIFGPEVLAKYVRVGNAIQRSAANRAVDTDGLVNSDQDVQQQEQQEQQAALAQQAAPNVAQAAGKLVTQSQAASLASTQGAGPQGQTSQPAAPAGAQ